MNATERGQGYVNVNEMPIILETAPTRINYQKTSGLILTACRNFFGKDENEKAFQEWKAGKEGKAG